MKLYYIANARIPTERAHGIQIMKMCEAFANLGLEVNLVLPTRTNPSWEKSDPFDYYQVQRKFVISKIFSPDPHWLIGLGDGIYTKVQGLFFSLSLFFTFLFRSPKDSFIYTRNEYLLPLLQLFSRKVVWEGHNISSRPKIYKRLWEKCLRLVVISKSLKDRLVGLGIRPDKILVAPDGVDLEEFDIEVDKSEVRLKLGLPEGKKLIIYTGHLYKWKGVRILLEAARLAALDEQGVKFIFVGGMTEEVNSFRKEAADLNNVEIVGQKPYSQIPLYLKAADCLVLPNEGGQDISEFYTSPLKLFEYMAAKRPIVASKLPSIEEILDDDKAILVTAGDPRALWQGIKLVLDNQNLEERLAENAYERVKNFTWQKRAELISKVIS